MLERRDQWLRHTGSNLRNEIEASLQRLILGELAQLRGAFRDDIAAEVAFLCELERFPGASLEDLESWKKIADLLLTQKAICASE